MWLMSSSTPSAFPSRSGQMNLSRNCPTFRAAPWSSLKAAPQFGGMGWLSTVCTVRPLEPSPFTILALGR
jgi:hypothetical protein